MIGRRDDRRGEQIKASFIVNENAITKRVKIVAKSRGKMSGHKSPRVAEFYSSLIMTATGELLKRELR